MAAPPPDRDDLPAWVGAAVHLSAYDPGWPARATAYADELRPVLGPWLLARSSTSARRRCRAWSPSPSPA